MARVLIIGVSKDVGLETTRQALEAGHQVRALSRSVAGNRLSNPNLEKSAATRSKAGTSKRRSTARTLLSRLSASLRDVFAVAEHLGIRI